MIDLAETHHTLRFNTRSPYRPLLPPDMIQKVVQMTHRDMAKARRNLGRADRDTPLGRENEWNLTASISFYNYGLGILSAPAVHKLAVMAFTKLVAAMHESYNRYFYRPWLRQQRLEAYRAAGGRHPNPDEQEFDRFEAALRERLDHRPPPPPVAPPTPVQTQLVSSDIPDIVL